MGRTLPTLRRAWPKDGPLAAICVQSVDVQCVLQFTLIHAAGCVLHRRTSRVIHRLKLFSLVRFLKKAASRGKTASPAGEACQRTEQTPTIHIGCHKQNRTIGTKKTGAAAAPRSRSSLHLRRARQPPETRVYRGLEQRVLDPARLPLTNCRRSDKAWLEKSSPFQPPDPTAPSG